MRVIWLLAVGLLALIWFMAYWIRRPDVQRDLKTFNEARADLGHELIRAWRLDRLTAWLTRRR